MKKSGNFNGENQNHTQIHPMENKLDILTRKLYDEGVEKARKEAEEIVGKANREAAEMLAEARAQADSIVRAGQEEAGRLKKRAEAETALSVKQAVASLKQQIADLVSGRIAAEWGKAGFQETAFVQELLLTVVKKWEITSGTADLECILPEKEKQAFSALVAAKYKELLHKGLEIKTGSLPETFVLQPRDGGYKITFSEELFEAFFRPYLKKLAKELLYA